MEKAKKDKIIGFLIKVAVVVVTVIIMWIFVGRTVVGGMKTTLEGFLQSEEYFGTENATIGQYKSSIRCFKTAIFLDKYCVFWNENDRIPGYYQGVAQAYANDDNPKKASKWFDKTIKAFERYCPDNEEAIAVAHVKAANVASILNDNADTIYHAETAAAFFKNNLEDSDAYTAASSFIWLANAYFNDSRYEEAAEYLEQAIPIYYESIDWGFGDEALAKMLAVLYKVTAETYRRLGDLEHYEEYNKLYEDFIWYRDFSEEDLGEIISYFHWMNK